MRGTTKVRVSWGDAMAVMLTRAPLEGIKDADDAERDSRGQKRRSQTRRVADDRPATNARLHHRPKPPVESGGARGNARRLFFGPSSLIHEPDRILRRKQNCAKTQARLRTPVLEISDDAAYSNADWTGARVNVPAVSAGAVGVDEMSA